ncbi:TetR/AcrR family transcriptional regulator [Nocardioides sp. GY 10113]|uniref:TetR/AcrR family transcriptional regulator n=1 Tax=Nocardioides sp. GY 10113 TaxID=2569761 RepID=UPI0010A77A48|nr:TetR/AcrR family transcriptional regulator [Nocardioides sp. GY 10113]TIC86756.1 TetR/AcrR family transcriptional regulator [Nocardioides sp. GY 10113]
MAEPLAGERDWARLVDRRAGARGDARRDALLGAFDELLRERSLEEINVAEISRRAGVSRSAFYFYFESKAVAVMALMADLYDEASATTAVLVSADGEPAERIRGVLERLFDSVDRTPHTYRALLEARAATPSVRETWDAGLADFAGRVAAMIRAERAAGRAAPGADADALAAVLLDLNNHALERHALGSGPPRAAHVEVLTSIWLRSIYGTESPAPTQQAPQRPDTRRTP